MNKSLRDWWDNFKSPNIYVIVASEEKEIDNRENKFLRKQLLKLPKLVKMKKKLILDSKKFVNEKDINAKKINYVHHSQTAQKSR